MTSPVPPAPVPAPPAPPAPPADGLLPQDQVSAIAAREHGNGVRKGRADAEAEFATELGVSLAEAKQILADHRTAQDAAKTEAQRAIEARALAEKDRDSAVAAARADAHAARLEAALLAAGVALPEGGTQTKDEKRAAALARMSRLVDVEVGVDVAAIASAVGALKTEMPALFAAPAAAANGDPGAGPRGGQGGGPSGLAAGRARAQAEMGSRRPAMTVDGTRPVFDYTR